MIFLLAVITISACRKDIDGEVESITIEPNIPILHDSGLGGLVINENGEPIADASIIYLDYETNTDKNGYFYFQNVPINENGNLLKIVKNGFFNGYRFYYPTDSNDSYSKTILIEKQSVGNFNASNGGEVNFGSVNLSFPANAIRYESSGNSYDGTVDVLAHYYDPSSSTLGLSMPGDLSGVDSESMAVQLATYGMMAVELVSPNGEKLNLNSESKAIMNMDVPDLLESNAPGLIPLWSLDEVSGFWKEDGSATLQDGEYVGEISHFSFWNCDAPFPLIRLEGTIVTVDNVGLSNSLICISVANNQAVTRSSHTDSRGSFNGKVPKGEALILRVKNDCGEVVYQLDLPPMEEDTDVGNINIGSVGEGLISGRIVCNGVPISNGYVTIKELSSGQFYVAHAAQDGTFEFARLYCADGEIEVNGFDLDNQTTSDTSIILSILNSSINNIGDLESCDIEIDEWFKYTIDGGQEYQTTEVEASINFNGLTILASDENYFIEVNFIDFINQQNLNPERFYFEGSGGFLSCFADCSGMLFEFSTIDLFTDGYIEGSYSGSLNAENSTVQVNGDFRIKLDEYIPVAWVEGIVWNDSNSNGIQDPGEQGTSDVFISAEVTGSGNARTTQTNGNGQFNLAVEAEQEITLNVLLGIGLLSPMNQGDDSLDSDFDPATNTLVLPAITEGETIGNIGVGVLELNNSLECFSVIPDNMVCEGSSTFLNIQVISGGVPPYTYQWEAGSTTSQQEIFENGTYYVTVIDANLNSCEYGVDFYEFEAATLAELEIVNAACQNNVGAATILNVNDYSSIEWSNGVNGASVTGLEPGIYTVNYVSNNGCEGFLDFQISNDSTVIGNQVWVDWPGGSENQLDTGDLPLSGVTVNLWEVSTNTIVDTQTTDSNGGFLFTGEYDGEYFAEFILPAGYEFVEQADITEIDNPLLSKVDPATGYTFIYNISCGEVNLTLDAGVKEL